MHFHGIRLPFRGQVGTAPCLPVAARGLDILEPLRQGPMQTPPDPGEHATRPAAANTSRRRNQPGWELGRLDARPQHKPIPARARRSEAPGRPPIGLGRFRGGSRSTRAQRSSGTRNAIPPHRLATGLASDFRALVHQEAGRTASAPPAGFIVEMTMEPAGRKRSPSGKPRSHASHGPSRRMCGLNNPLVHRWWGARRHFPRGYVP